MPVERSRTLSVLVVDDFEDNRMLYAGALEEAGYEVHEASDGGEALARARELQPNIIVMDLSMPVIDGWEVTRRLKADPSTARILIVALTGHTTNLGLQQAKDAGADLILGKPCLPDELLAQISALVTTDAEVA